MDRDSEMHLGSFSITHPPPGNPALANKIQDCVQMANLLLFPHGSPLLSPVTWRLVLLHHECFCFCSPDKQSTIFALAIYFGYLLTVEETI